MERPQEKAGGDVAAEDPLEPTAPKWEDSGATRISREDRNLYRARETSKIGKKGKILRSEGKKADTLAGEQYSSGREKTRRGQKKNGRKRVGVKVGGEEKNYKPQNEKENKKKNPNNKERRRKIFLKTTKIISLTKTKLRAL